MFYKAAFYDRRAHARLIRRFTCDRQFGDGTESYAFVVTDAGKVIKTWDIPQEHRGRTTVQYAARDAMEAEAMKWLTIARPAWTDPTAYWNDE